MLYGSLWTRASAAATSTNNSGDLAVGSYTELAIDVNITAASGTTPTMQLFMDRKGSDSVYYPIWQSVSITAVTSISTSVGSGMSIAQSLGSTIRLRWVIAGTTPSFTFSASLLAK